MSSTVELDIEELPTMVRWGVQYHQKVQLARSEGYKRYAPLPTRIRWWFFGIEGKWGDEMDNSL